MSSDKKRSRNRRVCVRLNDAEFEKFDAFTARAKISKDTYLRSMVNGLMLKPAPTDEMVEIIRQLRRIGNNINQLAIVANKTGNIDAALYRQNYEELQDEIMKIMKLLQEPVVIEEELCR